MIRAALALVLFVGISCNIWDNVYSQTYSGSPIILKESLNLDFTVPQYSLLGNFDYNSQLAMATVTLYFDLMLTKL